MKFSANLGFLWNDQPLPKAIYEAKAAGFHAVECHFPYDVHPADVRTALNETGLQTLGINTIRGNSANGEFGLAALPGREEAALKSIDLAIRYAIEIGARNVHVLAGIASGAQACQSTRLEGRRQEHCHDGTHGQIHPQLF